MASAGRRMSICVDSIRISLSSGECRIIRQQIGSHGRIQASRPSSPQSDIRTRGLPLRTCSARARGKEPFELLAAGVSRNTPSTCHRGWLDDHGNAWAGIGRRRSSRVTRRCIWRDNRTSANLQPLYAEGADENGGHGLARAAGPLCLRIHHAIKNNWYCCHYSPPVFNGRSSPKMAFSESELQLCDALCHPPQQCVTNPKWKYSWNR